MSKRITVTPQPRPADVNARLSALITGLEQANTIAQMKAAATAASRVPVAGKP